MGKKRMDRDEIQQIMNTVTDFVTIDFSKMLFWHMNAIKRIPAFPEGEAGQLQAVHLFAQSVLAACSMHAGYAQGMLEKISEGRGGKDDTGRGMDEALTKIRNFSFESGKKASTSIPPSDFYLSPILSDGAVRCTRCNREATLDKSVTPLGAVICGGCDKHESDCSCLEE